MKIKQIIFSIVLNLAVTSCQGARLQNETSNYIQNDSIKIVANHFLTHDVFINSFVVSDRDIEEAYQDHKEWVKEFFPTILKEYDLTLYSQFTLAIYLYVEGEKEHLKELWSKYGRLAGDKEKNLSPNEEFKPILNLLESFQISLK